jgi:hypothetical protein
MDTIISKRVNQNVRALRFDALVNSDDPSSRMTLRDDDHHRETTATH